MKKLIFIFFLFITLLTQAQYSTPKVWNFRTSSVEGRKPINADFYGKTVYCHNTTDSLIWIRFNNVITQGYTFYPYSDTIVNVHKVTVTSNTRYNAPYYQNSVKVSYGVQTPVKTNFTSPNTLIITWGDSTAWQLVRGVVTKTWRIYPYNFDTVAPPPPPPYYPTLASRIYVSPTGNNSSINPHSALTPYQTLYKACLTSAATDTIIMMAGIFTENNQCLLPVGVSILGAGKDSTFIKGHYSTTGSSTMTGATISLLSPTIGTNGNQFISNLTLDGDGLLGSRGIAVKNRSNVKVHDVVIKDFFLGGINFHNNNIFIDAIPAVYETGNQLYNSIINNCGDTPGTWNGGGLILIASQADMLIHDNLLYAQGRAQSHNGNIINAGGRHFRNLKYYNNKSYKNDNEGTSWNFHLEFWHIEGGVEIYNNEFYGGDCAIDCGGKWNLKGSYAYSFSIHDNLFQPISGHGGTSSYHPKTAITIEAWNTEDILVYDNHFKNWPTTVGIEDAPDVYCNVRRVSVYSNLMENTGWGAGVFSIVVGVQVEKVGNVMSDVSIYNNTIVSDNAGRTRAINVTIGGVSGTTTPVPGGSLSNLRIENNIFMYHTNQSPIYITNNGTITGFTIENNLSYNLANYNVAPLFWPYQNGTMTGYLRQNNIPISNTTQQNPLFVSTSDFHLQVGSPAIGTAKDGGNIGKY